MKTIKDIEQEINKKIQYNVLIVDDIPENLQLLSGFLYKKGIEVSVAFDGEQALKAIENETPDLILLDIAMPGMDGYEVCEILKSKEETKEIPIIFLTARNETEDIVRGFDLGAVDYITKPFKNKELIRRVTNQLELKRAKDVQNRYVKIIKNQNTELSELNATKDKFLSIIAHDLKNPFHILTSLSKMLVTNLQKYDEDRIMLFLENIYKTSMQGFSLLENLLNWTKSQTNRLELYPKKVDLNLLVNVNVELFNSQARMKKINLEKDILKEQFIWADENSITTVFRNLIGNALKFTNENGTVTIKARNKNATHFKIDIIDDGVGISLKNLEKLFRIDTHLTTNGTFKERGSGLGLLLCKEFVEKNNGEISVESIEGKGSVFSFTVPKFLDN